MRLTELILFQISWKTNERRFIVTDKKPHECGVLFLLKQFHIFDLSDLIIK